MEENTRHISEVYPPNSFPRILWECQKRASTLKCKQSLSWQAEQKCFQVSIPFCQRFQAEGRSYILQIISNLQLFVVITLQWLEEDFMMYLNNWEHSVKGRPGFKASEMKKMLLSSETRLGLSITGAIMFQ